MTQPNALDVLQARGFVQDATPGLRQVLDEGAVTFYYGCDPTAPSLHVGNLIGLMALAWLARLGHHPIALVGGSTGRVGDPSGRDEERVLMDDATVERHLAAIRAVVARVLASAGAPDFELVDNYSWTKDVTLLDFLRDVGKYASVNRMLSRESVKARLAREQGLSFTEFSYQLLQAYDYEHLHRTRGCRLQIGGSDQWGNIVSGVELVRSMHGEAVHALVWPLITRSDGKKFSKSSGGAIWLSPELTPPFAYYQWFLNVPDADLERFLLLFTFLDAGEISALAAEHAATPEQRLGQRRLAEEATRIAHGEEGLEEARRTTATLFGDQPFRELDDAVLGAAFDSVPVAGFDRDRLDAGVGLLEAMVAAGAARSNGEARRLVEGGGVLLNNARVDDPALRLGPGDLASSTTAVLRVGRRRYYLVRFDGQGGAA
jgi:tyrosyl-tRNA synthetase